MRLLKGIVHPKNLICLKYAHSQAIQDLDVFVFLTTWSHKNEYLCALFSETVFMYLTARLAGVSKRNVH